MDFDLPTYEEWLQEKGIDPSSALAQHARTRRAYDEYYKKAEYSAVLNGVQSGSVSALDAQGYAAINGYEFSPEQSEWINNKLSDQATDKAYAHQDYSAQNDLLWSANQLKQLGLNTGSVLQTGGSTAPSNQPANVG